MQPSWRVIRRQKIRTANYTQSKSQGPGVFTLCGNLFSCYIPVYCIE
jgi:hypothetical protein